jgi:hypothetical protein
MSLSRTQPVFEPISPQLINPVDPDNPIKADIVRIRPVAKDLGAIQPEEFDPRVPYGWGFFIYRAVFGEGADARFAEGLNRLEKWLRWEARDSRYRNEDADIWKNYPDYMPTPGERDITDEIAERMWNEVVEEYPDAHEIITEPEGSEDFSPIGRDFASRVESFDLDTGPEDEDDNRANTRYETCLIIDEKVLQILEALSADSLPVIPRDKSETKEAIGGLRERWIWILDRETSIDKEDGDVEEFPPWIRISLIQLRYLFFMRARGKVPYNWQGLVMEDTKHWDTVRWWMPMARSYNESSRAYRAEHSTFTS